MKLTDNFLCTSNNNVNQ